MSAVQFRSGTGMQIPQDLHSARTCSCCLTLERYLQTKYVLININAHVNAIKK